ncbi:MAG TPA: FtsX-like permease family protein [Acidobacteriota bacterium]|nr:FtsX-like permease family protein [Acidobacteriota bacterium]
MGVLLAALGTYGILSFIVGQRTREIGVRLALGAGLVDVLALAFGQGARLVIPGLMGGFAGALALTRWMSSLLIRVSPTDPLIFAFVAGLLIVVAFVACWLPARRALRIDPVASLKAE